MSLKFGCLIPNLAFFEFTQCLQSTHICINLLVLLHKGNDKIAYFHERWTVGSLMNTWKDVKQWPIHGAPVHFINTYCSTIALVKSRVRVFWGPQRYREDFSNSGHFSGTKLRITWSLLRTRLGTTWSTLDWLTTAYIFPVGSMPIFPYDLQEITSSHHDSSFKKIEMDDIDLLLCKFVHIANHVSGSVSWSPSSIFDLY